MTRRHSFLFGLVLLILVAIPLRHTAGDCCTADASGFDMRASSLTRSLAAGVSQPVNGDEEFFNAAATSGPSAPSSVMFLLDNSGSMMWLAQCTSGWDNGRCAVPSLSNPSDPSSSNSYRPTVRSRSDFSGTALAWMHGIAPVETYADPGYSDGAGYLQDVPPWTPAPAGTCSGNSCLFQKNRAYQIENWDETSATPEPGDGCTKYDGSNPDLDAYGNVITAGATCVNDLATKGFHQYRIRYVSSVSGGTRNISTYSRFVVSGKWLNANPPKFVSARKAIKALVRINPVDPKLRDKVRYGLSTFWNTNANGSTTNVSNGGSTSGFQVGDGATLVVPLGPDCATTTLAGYVQDRQAIINALNATGNSRIRFVEATPLAEALFNIAQYFSEPGAAGAHETRFTSTWVKAGRPDGISYWAGQDFRQSSLGAVGAAWASSSNQKSICWACQVSSAIVVTDGMPNNESGLPMASVSSYHVDNPVGTRWDFQRWRPTEYAQPINCGGHRNTTADRCRSYLPLVALYLNKYDMIPTNMDGTQNVIVHTISFGIDDAQALATLQATANLGGGRFANTNSTDELEDALTRAVNNVVTRATSFSSANTATLQTDRNQASETYFGRFKPNQTPSWEGHLFQAMLFDEFAMGCNSKVLRDADTSVVECGITTHSPNFDRDADASGYNACTGVFLVDQNCREIVQRGTDGAYVLASNLEQGASLPWDAGSVLCNPEGAFSGTANPCIDPLSNPVQPKSAVDAAYLSASDSLAGQPAPSGKPIRKIYTYLGNSSGLTEFRTTDATDLAALQKAMALDQPFCQGLLSGSGACTGSGCHTASNWVQADYDTCAKLVIYYVRGYDVFDLDADGCRSPVNSSVACPTGEERAWKLGDIFHSTPAVVRPPVDPYVCDLGVETQCAATIYSPQWINSVESPITPLATSGGVDAYTAWRDAHIDRPRVVLVGGNDGMLHAFEAGAARTTEERDEFGSVPYTSGSGRELWAFIPPDLLPRLKLLLESHQYMVDGPTMVRDVWVDGGPTGDPARRDSIKQANEFHTIAVVSERSGGTQFTALDVTDPVSPPRFLWSFPPPCSDDARWMAESWADFAPRPPPIGPVKIKSTAPRGFDERWVVMLNGGYDPALVKGRAVFMVDIWSGQTIWRFTDDDVKAMRGSTGSPVSMFPVAASVAMVDIGKPDRAGASGYDRDGYFDTANWGDLGGNLWVARFYEPGELDASGRVTNWFAARAFEQQRRSDDRMMVSSAGDVSGQVRSPFFYMTANAVDPASKTLRTILGTANREQMLQKGAACSPDNVMGCIQGGCTRVETSTVDEFGACTETQQLVYEDGLFTFSNTTAGTCGDTSLVCAPAAAPTYKGTTTWSFTCDGTTTTSSGTLTCNASGVCTDYREVGTGHLRTAGLTAPTFRDRLYSVWSYGGATGRSKEFATQEQAQDFDDLRFTDTSTAFTEASCGGGNTGESCNLVDVTWAAVTYASDSVTVDPRTGCVAGHSNCRATSLDAGWFYEYGRVCQVASCSPPTWTDERTASAANISEGCAAWSGFRPTASNTSSGGTEDVCTATPASTSSYSYLAEYVSGVPTTTCGFVSNGAVRRAVQRDTWSPPSTASARLAISGGQAKRSIISNDPGGNLGHTTLSIDETAADPIYHLDVSHEAHACRHADGQYCE